MSGQVFLLLRRQNICPRNDELHRRVIHEQYPALQEFIEKEERLVKSVATSCQALAEAVSFWKVNRR